MRKLIRYVLQPCYLVNSFRQMAGCSISTYHGLRLGFTSEKKRRQIKTMFAIKISNRRRRFVISTSNIRLAGVTRALSVDNLTGTQSMCTGRQRSPIRDRNMHCI